MKILVYGSLREGEYNFTRINRMLGKDSISKVGDEVVAGFQLRNLGAYPAATKGGESDKIVCDILEVNDEAKEFIDMMEEGAGYVAIPAGKENLPMYIHDKLSSSYPLVKSGDWKKRGVN